MERPYRALILCPTIVIRWAAYSPSLLFSFFSSSSPYPFTCSVYFLPPFLHKHFVTSHSANCCGGPGSGWQGRVRYTDQSLEGVLLTLTMGLGGVNCLIPAREVGLHSSGRSGTQTRGAGLVIGYQGKQWLKCSRSRKRGWRAAESRDGLQCPRESNGKNGGFRQRCNWILQFRKSLLVAFWRLDGRETMWKQRGQERLCHAGRPARSQLPLPT